MVRIYEGDTSLAKDLNTSQEHEGGQQVTRQDNMKFKSLGFLSDKLEINSYSPLTVASNSLEVIVLQCSTFNLTAICLYPSTFYLLNLVPPSSSFFITR